MTVSRWLNKNEKNTVILIVSSGLLLSRVLLGVNNYEFMWLWMNILAEITFPACLGFLYLLHGPSGIAEYSFKSPSELLSEGLNIS